MSKTRQLYWAVFNSHNRIDMSSIKESKKDSINEYAGDRATWNELKKAFGYRCRKIRIEIV